MHSRIAERWFLRQLLYEDASLDETAHLRAAKKLALLRRRIAPRYAERVLGRLAIR
jgi:hypothetical protein